MRTAAATILLVVLIASFAGRSAPRAADDPAPTTAIRGVLDQQAADWNRHDLDAFCAGYWKSPRLVFQSGGTRHVGFDAMRERYRNRYQAEGKEMGTLKFSDLDIEPLGPDTAFARGRWDLQMSGDKKLGGLFTLILRKFPDGWKIIHDHTSTDAP